MQQNLFKLGIICLLVPCVLFGNGLNLNNIGSKAIGMGGAFVGLADDYSAVHWNPAGLTQIEGTSVSLYVTDVIPSNTYSNSTYNVDATSEFSNYVSYAVGIFFDVGKKLKLGLYSDVPSGLGAKWDGEELKGLSNGTAYNWMSKIAAIHFGPAIAYQLSDKLSIGAVANIAYGMMELEQFNLAQYEESSTGMGYGATVGILYKPTEKLSIGASFKTENKISFSGTAKNPAFIAMQAPGETDLERDITWPVWIAGGIAYKATENLTLVADAQMTRWSTTQEYLETTFSDPTWQATAVQFGQNKMKLDWEDKIQIKLGAEYQLTSCLALRGGYYYDPAPAPDETLSFLLPSITSNAICIGAGWVKGALGLDFAVEYLIGSERDVEATPHNRAGIHNMNIIVPNIALNYAISQ